MNEKCSLSNLNMYLRVTGFLSLIIILIIVVYYYLQSNHSKILEKYENYALRDCKVYFTEGDTNIKNCDITQETSNYTGSCSYRFDGWNEFDTYTDNDGKTITYPKKVYTQTRTNTNDFDNPMFTNNCFKTYTTDTCIPGQPTDNCTPPEFEYNTNGIVKYDEIGKSGNSAVGNNIYGGTGYSSMQFLNTTDPRTNNINLISSICDVPLNNTLGSLKDKVFYMFEFNATTNKLENIRSVTLNSDQTTFSPVSSDNVLMNLPLRPIDASFYGLQYDATNNNLPIKIFKKNDKLRNVSVFKFNYMSYICTQSQIKNYMTARRNIYPEKFIKYGSSSIPYYSKNISISNNMTIKDGWGWSNYSSADLNLDYSDMLKMDLNTSKDERKSVIRLSYADREKTAEQEYNTAKEVFDAASQSRDDFATNNPTFSSLIGKSNDTSTATIFNYTRGYNISSIDNLNISIPKGAIAKKDGSYLYISFPYTSDSSGLTGQTLYTFTTTEALNADILVVGGGGGGGARGGGGGGGGILFGANMVLNSGSSISIKVGKGGTGGATTTFNNGTNGFDSSIVINSTEYIAKGGGGGGTRNASVRGQNGSVGGSGGGGSTANFTPQGFGGLSNQSTYTNFQSFGNNGGAGKPDQFGGQPLLSGGGGGGAGGTGGNYILGTGGGNGGLGKDFIAYFGTSVGHNGYFGGGGGGMTYNAPGMTFAGNQGYGNGGNGLSGGGGNGGLDGTTSSTSFEYPATDGLPNTGGGGGGGKFDDGQGTAEDNNGGHGGTGFVIIRYRIKDTISNTSLGSPLSDNTANTITLSKSFQTNVLSAFIFLERGTYRFKAEVAGASYNNNILYSELIIYETINNNNNIVYKYVNKPTAQDITINYGKFYKLAFRFIYYNFSDIDINLSFKIYGNDNDLTSYLFTGANINKDYTNSTIMNVLSDVKYVSNIKEVNYVKLFEYLKDINFFNIANLQKDMNTKKNYKEVVLPAMIIAEYGTDENIKNIQKFIDKIDDLKSNRVIVNYGSHLPTTSPSIYKEITIDDIFGKSFDRLITKERVDPLIQPPVPSTKKIYVEAVAA